VPSRNYSLTGWWREIVVECCSLAGELFLSCARPASNKWPVVWVNRPLQVSQLGQLCFSFFAVDKWVVSCNQMSALVAPSGECLQGEGLVWLIGAVVCSLADYRRSNCSLAHAIDGRICAAAPLALADQLPLPMIVNCGRSVLPIRQDALYKILGFSF